MNALAQPAEIEVLELRPVDKGGSIRAIVSLRVGGLTLHGC
jgi:hypothetical protein